MDPWGAYSSLQAKVSRKLDVGVRFDHYTPDVKPYASLAGPPEISLSPLAVTEDGAHRWLGAVYVTWWQSPFVKYRIQYDREDGKGMGDPEDLTPLMVILMLDIPSWPAFSAG